MTRSLADLRKSPPKSRPERSLTLCLAPHLVAEVQRLIEELSTIPVARTDDDEPDGPPRRIGQGESPRSTEIKARLAELRDEMAEHEGELRLRATSDGDWRRWVNAHPARDEGEPGHKRDQEVAGGYCNADDLIDSLGTYAYSWAGELLAEGDWSILADSLSGPDLKQAATLVVAMHESRLDIPFWSRGWSATLQSASVSESPATSASVPGGSSVGNLPSSTSTSTQTESQPA